MTKLLRKDEECRQEQVQSTKQRVAQKVHTDPAVEDEPREECLNWAPVVVVSQKHRLTYE